MNKNQLKKVFTDIYIKDDMQQRLMDNCNNFKQEKNFIGRCKNVKKFNKTAIIAAMMSILVIGFTTITYGQDIYEKVKEIVFGGYAHYIADDYTDNSDFEADVDSESNKVNNLNREDFITRFNSPSEAQAHLNFSLKIPEFLPQGYELDRIELYNDENGKLSGEYADIYFTKGEKYIFTQARLMNEETAFATSLNGLKEIEINGYKGLIGKQNLDIDIEGVMYMLSSSSADIDSAELVNMVESLK